ncbi:MAG: oligoendopeptidase F [Butyrivibrio sp.]|nr:oligoendopeptidase F [Butyrivibrio sp.]
MKKRSEVSEDLKWDLTRLCKDADHCRKELEECKEICKKLVEKYKGKLKDAKTINSCINEYEELITKLDYAVAYAGLDVSTDYGNTEALQLDAVASSASAYVFTELSFIDSELATVPAEVLEEAMKDDKVSKLYIKDTLREMPHKLSPETERVLASLRQTFQAPYNMYNQTKLADMKFGDVEVDGKKYPLGYATFEDDYESVRDTKLRRAASKAFYSKLREYMNTTAAEYGTQVNTEKTLSEIKHYDSVFDYLLFDQKVTREMYDRQIDIIMEKLAPHMRKYARLLKKANGLDKMTYADLKIALDPDYDPHVTIEESKKYILDGLSIMGEDYVEMLKRAYDERWIDFAQNEGKSTGGFCESPYRRGSYILLTWNERMSDVFTLAHELGHAGHFNYASANQHMFDTNVSNYVVEAPSTINELLMAEYLKTQNKDDKRFRRWVLAAQISNTYYHNFVTHLLEAAYQREVYKLVDKHEAVPAEVLNNIYRDVLKRFWGDEVELTENCELTWMRQPHYYMGLYSYSYSASLTIATQVMKRILNEGQSAVDDWKKTLAAGAVPTPAEFARMAGVDVTTDAALLDTIEYIGSIIDEIEELTD